MERASLGTVTAVPEARTNTAGRRASKSLAAVIQAIVDQLPSGVLVVDPDARVQLRNAAGRRILHGSDAAAARLAGDLAGYAMLDESTRRPLEPSERPLTRALQGERVDLRYVLKRPEPLDEALIQATAAPLCDPEGRITGAVMVYWDVTHQAALAREHERTQAALSARIRQQAAVAELGQLAVRASVQEVLDRAVAIVADTLEVECTSIAEVAPTGDTLEVRADTGWLTANRGLPIPTSVPSPTNKALLTNTPVIVEDYERQAEFAPPPAVRFPGLRSCLSMPVRLDSRLYGVLGVFSTRPRAFTSDDIHFVELVANVIGGAVDRARARDAIAASEERYRHIVETAQEGIWIIDSEGSTTFANLKMAQMLGCSLREFLDSSVFDWLAPEVREFVEYSLQRRREGVSEQYDSELRRKDGTRVWVSISASPMFDDSGTFVGALSMVADITARKEAESALAYQALHDSLTGLPNRALLQDRLEQTIAQVKREERAAAVMFLDLDGFKDVNDSFGHASGDQLLCQVGPRLRGVLRQTDTIARLGGDEFAVILYGVGDADEACGIAAKMLKTLEGPFVIDERALEVTASIGIALCPNHGDDVTTLLQHADSAMYAAKQQKNTFSVYAAPQAENASFRLTLTADLRQAIDQEALELYYQPKVAIGSGSVVGVEALARWPHPHHGLLSPDRFIPIAEQTGLIRPLSRWALGTALRQVRTWQERGIPLSAAVNLSMRDLRDPLLTSNIEHLLNRWQVDPGWLKIEITETVIMADPRQTMNVVTRLHDMGIAFCIDDFGTGYSSLSYLKQLPAQEIKIDKSFVMDLLTDENDLTIVRSVIDLAHNLGRVTVAEGVETEGIWNRLAELGCDLAQGFYLSHPLPAAEFERWLTARA